MQVRPRILALAFVLATVVAGCASPQPTASPNGDEADAEPTWADVELPCGPCYEPTLASDGTYVYLTVGNGDTLQRSRGDGVWETLPGPALPDGSRAAEADVFVQVDDAGRLWWSALAPWPAGGTGVHVARSDDQGRTWTANALLDWPAAGLPGPTVADRNWVAVLGDRVVVACTCPVGALPQVRISDDAGHTFGPPVPILQAYGRPGPLGPLAATPDGILVAPFLVGASASPSDLPGGGGVAAVVSRDGGATWERVDVWSPVEAAPVGGTRCCAFPNAAGTATGVVVAWAGSDGSIWTAISEDGTGWTLARSDGSAVYPHPWPVPLEDGTAVAWAGADGRMHLTSPAGDVDLGERDRVVGDYVTAVRHGAQVLVSWPGGDVVRVASVSLGPAGQPADKQP